MQNLKDTLYITLRDRMAAQFPAQTIVIGDETRPAILVAENEMQTAASEHSGAFCLRFGSVGVAEGSDGPAPLLKMLCEISYSAEGTDELSFQDRGRELAKLDSMLLAIAAPPRAALKDFTQSPAGELGAQIFWTRPELGDVKADERELRRTATLDVFGFADVQ